MKIDTFVSRCFILVQIMTGIFEKFKEKKLNVLTALREASDAVYLTVRTSLGHMTSIH